MRTFLFALCALLLFSSIEAQPTTPGDKTVQLFLGYALGAASTSAVQALVSEAIHLRPDQYINGSNPSKTYQIAAAGVIARFALAEVLLQTEDFEYADGSTRYLTTGMLLYTALDPLVSFAQDHWTRAGGDYRALRNAGVKEEPVFIFLTLQTFAILARYGDVLGRNADLAISKDRVSLSLRF